MLHIIKIQIIARSVQVKIVLLTAECSWLSKHYKKEKSSVKLRESEENLKRDKRRN